MLLVGFVVLTDVFVLLGALVDLENLVVVFASLTPARALCFPTPLVRSTDVP
jgi:hypothetical protein